MKKIKGQIGYCDNKNLPGLEHVPGGHYVYIRDVKPNGKCDINVVTSLEDNNNNVNYKKIRQVKKGNTYSIPLYDADFTRWSGINKTPICNVDVSKIQDIGKKKIKTRHKFFIGKFLK